MSWLIAADLHLRPETWARLPQLRGDAYESLRQIVDIAVQNSVDGIILLGDVFDAAYPDALSVKELANAADKAREHNIRLLIIQGNHDAVSVRGADQAPVAWANAVNAEWVHKQEIELSKCCLGYALDYTPPGELAAALAAVPTYCTVLFAHQSWAELQRIGHTDGNAAMLPPHIRFLITGDNHKKLRVAVNGPGGQVTIFSPGSTCMQAMNEEPEKFVYIVSFHTATTEPAITPIQLVTRQFLQLEFATAADFDAFVSQPWACPASADGRARPPALQARLIKAKVSDTVPDYKARLRAVIGDGCHIDCEPLLAVITEVEIDYEAVAVQGGFETLTSAVQTLAARDGSPPGVVEDVIALLCSNDRNAALTEIRTRFLERMAADGKKGGEEKQAC